MRWKAGDRSDQAAGLTSVLASSSGWRANDDGKSDGASWLHMRCACLARGREARRGLSQHSSMTLCLERAAEGGISTAGDRAGMAGDTGA